MAFRTRQGNRALFKVLRANVSLIKTGLAISNARAEVGKQRGVIHKARGSRGRVVVGRSDQGVGFVRIINHFLNAACRGPGTRRKGMAGEAAAAKEEEARVGYLGPTELVQKKC